jgi:hypothetical protein
MFFGLEAINIRCNKEKQCEIKPQGIPGAHRAFWENPELKPGFTKI